MYSGGYSGGSFGGGYNGGAGGGGGAATMQQPAPPTAGQGSTQLTPAYMSTMFPNGLPMSSIDTSPDAITQAIMQSLTPQFNQQDLALNNELASAGIMGGSAVPAMAALGQQQQTTAAGDISPYIMQGKEMGIGQQEFDINNIIRAAMGDQSTQNEFMQFLLGGQNQDWLAQMGMAGNLAEGEAGGITSAYNPQYMTPPNLGNSFMQFAGGVGPGVSYPTQEQQYPPYQGGF